MRNRDIMDNPPDTLHLRRTADSHHFAQDLVAELSATDLRHVLTVFASDLARLTTELAYHAQRDDPHRFTLAAKALSGAAGAVGATALEAACRAAVQATRETGTSLAVLHAKIDAEISLVEVDNADLPRVQGGAGLSLNHSPGARGAAVLARTARQDRLKSHHHSPARMVQTRPRHVRPSPRRRRGQNPATCRAASGGAPSRLWERRLSAAV
jgi:HPt (histidine-containing phosphotransfer) domain-containing protein